MFRTYLGLCLVLAAVLCAEPPDKNYHHHRLKRSVDLNEAHTLSTEYRLLDVVMPYHYNLSLEPYMEDAKYTGRVSIGFNFTDRTEMIELHCAKTINIQKLVVYTGVEGRGIKIDEDAKWEYNTRKPIVTITLSSKNEHKVHGCIGTIEITFNSSMETRTTTGFFKSFYSTGKTDHQLWPVAAFQMRPTNARRVFPCFDEPGYKATFDIDVVIPKHTRIFGGTPVDYVENIEGEPDAHRVYFDRTPRISTFALGLVIANFTQCNETIIYNEHKRSRVEIRIWGREELFPALHGLNKKISKVFKEVADYWDSPLPLSRLDILAIPDYQVSKPADSFGLIIFKEIELANSNYLQLAQELSYQWAGILSTPQWWSDLHLNKALNGYIAARAVEKIDNGVDGPINENWPMHALYPLYYEFSKRYPHSKITGMKQETQATKIELILRMFNFTLGPNVFQKCMQEFMDLRREKTFNEDNLWNIISNVNQKINYGRKTINVTAVAKSWTSVDRLPYVTVERTNNNELIVTQRMYISEHHKDVKDRDRVFWWIPLLISSEDEIPKGDTEHLPSLRVKGTRSIWIEPVSETIIPVMPSRDKFIIVNAEEVGPFMVNYDQENWERLSSYMRRDKLNHKRIPVLTRAKLLHDSWNLAFAGYLGFKHALDMTLFLPYEEHHLVWEPFFTMVDRMSRRIGSKFRDVFNKYVTRITEQMRARYGPKDMWRYQDTPAWIIKHREVVQSFLCRSNYPACTNDSIRYFELWVNNTVPLENIDNPYITHQDLVNVGNTFICPALEYGTKDMYQHALRRLLISHWRKKSDRTFLLKALAGCPRTADKIHILLDVCVMNFHANISETDQHLIFSIAGNTVDGTQALFSYVRAHFEALRKKFVKNTNLWDNMINSATTLLTTDENYDKLHQFYLDRKGEFASADHIMERNIKDVKELVSWSNFSLPVIQYWLNNYINGTYGTNGTKSSS